MATPLSLMAYLAFASRSETPTAKQLLALRDRGEVSNEAYNEYMAIALPDRPQGSLVWLNAGTPRALFSAAELFRRLRDERPDISGLLTTNFEPNPSQFQPVDGLWLTRLPEERSSIIARFLSHWAPDCVIWVGGRFRPALLHATHQQDIPMLSIDAPDSPLSLETTYNVPGLRAPTMRLFDHVITGDAAQVVPWRRAGLDPNRIEAHGFLEESANLPHFNEAELNTLSHELSTRPIWFAVKISSTEISSVICAHKSALRRSHRLFLILSVGDAADAERAAALCKEAGLNTVMRNHGDLLTEAVQVLIVQDSEEDGLWYRLASVSFLGKSLSNGGGVDPYPAATFGSAMLHGPHVENFSNAYGRFKSAKATREVKNGEALGDAVSATLAADVAAEMAHAAWEICSAGAEGTDRVTDLLHDILDLREEMTP